MRGVWRALPISVLVVLSCSAGLACRSPRGTPGPTIAFDQIPEAAPGGARDMATIAGRVTGAAPGQRIVLYARTEGWWVQPTASDPYTAIAPDGTWKSSTHLGAEYPALLVGGHTTGPNWPTFLMFASRYLKGPKVSAPA